MCNLQFKTPKATPVIFQNLANYDSHLFVMNRGKSEFNIKCIPNNEEKYICFNKDVAVVNFGKKEGKEVKDKNELHFLDIDKSVSNLSLEKLQETEKVFKDNTEFISRKGVYPYDYMSSIEKFNEISLPLKEKFLSQLNDCGILDEDYEHEHKVWKEFDITTKSDYHDLYLKTDVLLLADVFQEFRSVCLEKYSLDLAWYYTSPGLSFDALLKVSDKKLELQTDIDMLY